VCVVDPICCTAAWDQTCVNQARTSCLTAGTPPVLSFNEIRADEPSNTDPNEYIEIKGVPGTSLNGVSIVVVGDGLSLNGNIEAIISLNGVSIPKDGICLIAESTFTLATPDAVRSMNLENGDSVTYFLVWNFTGLLNTDIDANDDCTLDSTPWDATIDSLGVISGDGRCVYSATTVGPAYAGFPATGASVVSTRPIRLDTAPRARPTRPAPLPTPAVSRSRAAASSRTATPAAWTPSAATRSATSTPPAAK
jgi:hypothetical protein